MRIDATVCFLLLASLTATPAISQDATAAGSRNSLPVITNISVVKRAGSVEVEIRFSELVEAEVNALEHPDRLVFDFAECALARSVQRLTVNRGPVVAVRASAFSVSPPVTRVVIDLTSPQDHEDV